mgnify:CR=1 FL=1
MCVQINTRLFEVDLKILHFSFFFFALPTRNGRMRGGNHNNSTATTNTQTHDKHRLQESSDLGLNGGTNMSRAKKPEIIQTASATALNSNWEQQQQQQTSEQPATASSSTAPTAATSASTSYPSATSSSTPRVRIWLELGGPDGSGAVEVGQATTLTVRAIVPGNMGVRVVDCAALDGLGESTQQLLDERGCPIDEQVSGYTWKNSVLT